MRVTVCLALAPPYRSEIILVSDQLLSSDNNSVEGPLKLTKLAYGIEWWIMFAGYAPRFAQLIDRVREPLGGVKETRLTLETVVSFVERAYYLEIQKLIEMELLLPYGLTRDEFLKKGKRWLGEVRFNSVADQIERVDLGIELLVVGLDAMGTVRIFDVSSRGVVTHPVLPYHAIGSGAYLALGAMYQLAFFPYMDTAENVYRACAAKFAAESAPGVGRETLAMVIEPMTGASTLITNIDELRDLWQTRGQPPMPAGARRLIRRDLKILTKTIDHILKGN